MAQTSAKPKGRLAIQTVAMPADTNPSGDIFGGWLLSQMDIAGGIVASQRARGRAATVAVEAMLFHRGVAPALRSAVPGGRSIYDRQLSPAR